MDQKTLSRMDTIKSDKNEYLKHLQHKEDYDHHNHKSYLNHDINKSYNHDNHKSSYNHDNHKSSYNHDNSLKLDGGKKFLDPNESKMDINKHSNRSKTSTYTPANFNPFIKENCNDSSF